MFAESAILLGNEDQVQAELIRVVQILEHLMRELIALVESSSCPGEVNARGSDATATVDIRLDDGMTLLEISDPGATTLPTVIDFSVWDSETDAKEVEKAARSLFAKVTGKPELPVGQQLRRRLQQPEYFYL